jgi:hypothetical protein
MDSLDGTRYVLLDQFLGSGRPEPEAERLEAERLVAESLVAERLKADRAKAEPREPEPGPEV